MAISEKVDRRRHWTPERRVAHRQAMQRFGRARKGQKSLRRPSCLACAVTESGTCSQCWRRRACRMALHNADHGPFLTLTNIVIDRWFWLNAAAYALTYTGRRPDELAQLPPNNVTLEALSVGKVDA